VFVLTVTSGTVGVEVKPGVGVGPGVDVNSGVDVKAPGCNRVAWAVTVNARSGVGVVFPLGRLHAVRDVIKSADNIKTNLFLSIFSLLFIFIMIMT
jgi:hypothetical protein